MVSLLWSLWALDAAALRPPVVPLSLLERVHETEAAVPSGHVHPVSCAVQVVVDTHGVPEDVEPLSCPAAYEDEATRAVSTWRWAAPRQDGEPVRARIEVEVTFPEATLPVVPMNRSQLHVRTRTQPAYPLGVAVPRDQRCMATVFVGAQGMPYQVDVAGCDAAFHKTTRTALLQWRWAPPRAAGAPVRARTIMRVIYRRR